MINGCATKRPLPWLRRGRGLGKGALCAPFAIKPQTESRYT